MENIPRSDEMDTNPGSKQFYGLPPHSQKLPSSYESLYSPVSSASLSAASTEDDSDMLLSSPSSPDSTSSEDSSCWASPSSSRQFLPTPCPIAPLPSSLSPFLTLPCSLTPSTEFHKFPLYPGPEPIMSSKVFKLKSEPPVRSYLPGNFLRESLPTVKLERENIDEEFGLSPPQCIYSLPNRQSSDSPSHSADNIQLSSIDGAERNLEFQWSPPRRVLTFPAKSGTISAASNEPLPIVAMQKKCKQENCGECPPDIIISRPPRRILLSSTKSAVPRIFFPKTIPVVDTRKKYKHCSDRVCPPLRVLGSSAKYPTPRNVLPQALQLVDEQRKQEEQTFDRSSVKCPPLRVLSSATKSPAPRISSLHISGLCNKEYQRISPTSSSVVMCPPLHMLPSSAESSAPANIRLPQVEERNQEEQTSDRNNVKCPPLHVLSSVTQSPAPRNMLTESFPHIYGRCSKEDERISLPPSPPENDEISAHANILPALIEGQVKQEGESPSPPVRSDHRVIMHPQQSVISSPPKSGIRFLARSLHRNPFPPVRRDRGTLSSMSTFHPVSTEGMARQRKIVPKRRKRRVSAATNVDKRLQSKNKTGRFSRCHKDKKHLCEVCSKEDCKKCSNCLYRSVRHQSCKFKPKEKCLSWMKKKSMDRRNKERASNNMSSLIPSSDRPLQNTSNSRAQETTNIAHVPNENGEVVVLLAGTSSGPTISSSTEIEELENPNVSIENVSQSNPPEPASQHSRQLMLSTSEENSMAISPTSRLFRFDNVLPSPQGTSYTIVPPRGIKLCKISRCSSIQYLTPLPSYHGINTGVSNRITAFPNPLNPPRNIVTPLINAASTPVIAHEFESTTYECYFTYQSD